MSSSATLSLSELMCFAMKHKRWSSALTLVQSAATSAPCHVGTSDTTTKHTPHLLSRYLGHMAAASSIPQNPQNLTSPVSCFLSTLPQGDISHLTRLVGENNSDETEEYVIPRVSSDAILKHIDTAPWDQALWSALWCGTPDTVQAWWARTQQHHQRNATSVPLSVLRSIGRHVVSNSNYDTDTGHTLASSIFNCICNQHHRQRQTWKSVLRLLSEAQHTPSNLHIALQVCDRFSAWEGAIEVFQKGFCGVSRGAVEFSALTSVLQNHKNGSSWRIALNLMWHMQVGWDQSCVFPSRDEFTKFLVGCRESAWSLALRYVAREMRFSSVLDPATLKNLVTLCSHSGQWECVLMLYQQGWVGNSNNSNNNSVPPVRLLHDVICLGVARAPANLQFPLVRHILTREKGSSPPALIATALQSCAGCCTKEARQHLGLPDPTVAEANQALLELFSGTTADSGGSSIFVIFESLGGAIHNVDDEVVSRLPPTVVRSFAQRFATADAIGPSPSLTTQKKLFRLLRRGVDVGCAAETLSLYCLLCRYKEATAALDANLKIESAVFRLLFAAAESAERLAVTFQGLLASDSMLPVRQRIIKHISNANTSTIPTEAELVPRLVVACWLVARYADLSSCFIDAGVVQRVAAELITRTPLTFVEILFNISSASSTSCLQNSAVLVEHWFGYVTEVTGSIAVQSKTIGSALHLCESKFKAVDMWRRALSWVVRPPSRIRVDARDGLAPLVSILQKSHPPGSDTTKIVARLCQMYALSCFDGHERNFINKIIMEIDTNG